jgi:hypothetical protein
VAGKFHERLNHVGHNAVAVGIGRFCRDWPAPKVFGGDCIDFGGEWSCRCGRAPCVIRGLIPA